MEKKKYVLKKDVDNTVKPADGTENGEHIFDMIDRAKMCFGNIQDNTDLAAQIFKLNKNNLDEDELDALQLLCEDAIAIEKEGERVMGELSIDCDKIDKHIKVSEGKIEEYLKAILLLEMSSKNIIEKILRR